MLKSKTMILFIIFVLGVAYIGTNTNISDKQFNNDENNIIIINE